MRALVAAEILIAVIACAYGSFVLPRHSLAACVAYVAFCAIMAVAAAVLWYVFVARRLVWWGRSATPARLAKVLAASFATAVLVELGTLVGAPLSSPFTLGDWHASRIAAFFAMALPVMCCVVMYDWRSLALRLRGSLLANHARLAKRLFAHTAASVAACALAALTFGLLSEWTGVGNRMPRVRGRCRRFGCGAVRFAAQYGRAARAGFFGRCACGRVSVRFSYAVVHPCVVGRPHPLRQGGGGIVSGGSGIHVCRCGAGGEGVSRRSLLFPLSWRPELGERLR